MVLVDAGGVDTHLNTGVDLTQFYSGYVTDITRTWPLTRKFTDPQRDLYQVSRFQYGFDVGCFECTEGMHQDVL